MQSVVDYRDYCRTKANLILISILLQLRSGMGGPCEPVVHLVPDDHRVHHPAGRHPLHIAQRYLQLAHGRLTLRKSFK